MIIRGKTIVAAPLMAALFTTALAGCSGGAGTEAGASAGTGRSPSSSSGSPSATQDAGDAAESDGADPTESDSPDPCLAVRPAHVRALVPARRRDQVVLTRTFTSDGRGAHQYTCKVSYSDGKEGDASWGYQLGSYGMADLQAKADELGGKEIHGLGFASFTRLDLFSSDAFGLVDGTAGVYVSVFEGVDAITTDGFDTPRRALVAVIGDLAEAVPIGSRQPSIVLPESCPAADSPELAATFGHVARARGGGDDAHEFCLYANDRQHSVLRLDLYRPGAAGFREVYDATRTNPHHVQMVDGPPGTIRMVSIGDAGDRNSAILEPAVDTYLTANVSYRDQARRRHVDRAAFLRFTESYGGLRLDDES